MLGHSELRAAECRVRSMCSDDCEDCAGLERTASLSCARVREMWGGC